MKWIQRDSEFRENTLKYRRSDGILAIILFLIVCFEYALLAFGYNFGSFIKDNITIVGCIVNLLMIFVVLLFLKVRKEKIASIGLCGGKWRCSVLIGCIFAGILFYNNCISHIVNGAGLVPFGKACLLVVYFFLVSMCEEIVFRGYIGTRLYGLIKNPVLCICVNGVLFILMHFPYRMIAYGKSLSDLTLHSIPWLIDLFVTHVVLSLIYQKTNSLYGAIIPHWASNLAYELVVR